jgi:hypothetical protein
MYIQLQISEPAQGIMLSASGAGNGEESLIIFRTSEVASPAFVPATLEI